MNKYILYAIGEIFLVVIGILIALQINNWNEERTIRSTEAKLLEELYQDLHETAIEFEQNLTFDRQIANSKDVIISVIENDLPWHDSLQRHFNYFNYWNGYSIKRTAYNSIENWGINNIANDRLRRKIVHVFQDGAHQLATSELEERDIQLATINDIISTRMDWGNIQQVRPVDYRAFLNNDEFRWRLTTFNAFKRITIRNRSQVLEDIIDTKNAVQEELKQYY